MKNKYKVISTLVLLLICIGITVLLFLNNLYNYLIVLVPVTLMAGLSFVTEYKNSFATEKEIYEGELNRILKTYDGILVNINKFPKLKNKSVLHVSKIEDLVDAQAEMRKPIYYIRREIATAFYLLNDDIFLIYFLKQTPDEMCGLEAEIKRLELEGSLKIENFKDIDKTFILQTDEKSYKVSPIREKVEEPKEEEKTPEVNEQEELQNNIPEEENNVEEIESNDTEIEMPVFEQAPVEEPEPYIEPEEVIETGTIEEEVFEETYTSFEKESDSKVDEEITPVFDNNSNPNHKKKKKKKKKKNKNNGQNQNFNQQ